MIPKKRNARLFAIALFGLALSMAAYLVFSALRQNISFFYSPAELAQEAPGTARKLRLGGMVEKGSLERLDGLNVRFRVTDFKRSITVRYDKILPDLFREGQGVIAEGHLAQNGEFIASRVLAKHDENYMPPEVGKALDKAKTE